MNIVILTENHTLRAALTYEIHSMGFSISDTIIGFDETDITIIDTATVRSSQIKTENVIFIQSDSCAEDISDTDTVLVRPFAISDLKAAINKLLFGIVPTEPGKPGAGKLSITISDNSIIVNDQKIDLTRNEMRIFTELWKEKGNAVSRERLDEITGANRDGNMVTVYINRLREKLSAVTEKRIIKTIRGGGYTISDL